MFLRPFLKYLKPHRMRLALAFICMFGVGFFGTYNILLVKPALDVLFGLVNYREREAEVDETIIAHTKKLQELQESDRWIDKLQKFRKDLYYPTEHKARRLIFGSSFFHPEEFKNPRDMVLAIRDSQSPVLTYIREQTSPDTQQLLKEYKEGKTPSESLMESLVRDLNTNLADEKFYDSTRFADVRFSTKTLKNIIEPYYTKALLETTPLTTETLKNLIENSLTQGQTVRVNRYLLSTVDRQAFRAERPMSLYHYADKNNTKCLRWIAAFIVIMGFCNAILDYGFKYQISFSLYSSVIALKSDLFRHVMSQDMRFFANRSVGFLMSRITSDVLALRNLFQLLVKDAIQQAVQLVFLFTLLLFINPKMTAMVFLMVLPSFVILAYFARQVRKVTRKHKRRKDVLSAAMNESLGSIRLIKALATEEIECDRFDRHNFKLFYYEMKQRIAKFASSPIMEFLGTVAVALVLVFGGYAVLNNKIKMEPSDFMIYIIALAAFYKPIKRLSRMNVNWQVGRISVERISEILALEPTVTDPGPDIEPTELDHIREGLAVEDVTFAYEKKIILHHITAGFPHGTVTAIVGRSGSGKSTLANLLLRLYDPDKGVIKLDGHDLRTFRVKDLRSHFGIVTQDTILFDDTVANNIAYGSKDLNQEKIIQAAKAANAHEFITTLNGSEGYDSQVGPGGSNLSGGQRQRLAIARAFYRDPKILLLDEATSSLDNESEAVIQENLGPLMKNRTVIVIAHRLSTIMHADNILVLEDGQIVEQGPHSALIAKGAHYATLYKLGEFAQE